MAQGMLTAKGEWSDDDNDSRDWRFIVCETTPPWNSWLVEGAYVRFVQWFAALNDHSESRDLLVQSRVISEQSNRRQKLQRCWGKSMNTAIGACMETGMAGYIAIITGRIPAMAYRLTSPKLYSWQSLAGKPASVSIPFTRRAQPELAPEKTIR